MDRKEAYEYIKKNNLQDVVKTKYGRNYTQVSTNDLIKVIESSMKKNEVTEVKKCCETSSKEVSKKVDSNVNLGVVSELKKVIEDLYKDDELTDYAYETLADLLELEKTSKKKKAVEDMSFDELVNEFKFDN